MSLSLDRRRRIAYRIVVLVTLFAGSCLFVGCSSDHPTAPDKPVTMKSGARGGHRPVTYQ